MVMGGDSSFKGHEFESRQPYNGWTFFTYIFAVNFNVFEKMKNEKEAGVGPFFKKAVDFGWIRPWIH